MSSTYDPNLLTDKDLVRFITQDVFMTSPLFQDQEINAMLGIWGSYKSTAIALCELLAQRFAAEADLKRIGNERIDLKEKSKRYLNMAHVLRAQTLKFIVPYAGGISESDHRSNQQDQDVIKPSFTRRMMENKSISPIEEEEP